MRSILIERDSRYVELIKSRVVDRDKQARNTGHEIKAPVNTAAGAIGNALLSP